MTIVNAENRSNGPAQLDISIEQEADFQLAPQLLLNGAPFNLTGVTLTAWLTVTWNPPLAPKIPMTVVVTDVVNGFITITLTAAQTKTILANQPTPSSPGPRGAPRNVALGGWVLYANDGTNTNRLLDGDVFLDRDPTQ